jgi:hypothetical protein
LRVSISGVSAHAALLKLKRSAETEILGKKLRLTGPAIFKSRPVEDFTELISKVVNFTGSTAEATYHEPTPPKKRTLSRILKMILNLLVIVS